MLKEIGDEDFEKEVLEEESLTIVSLSSEWCPGCKRMAPVLEKIAGDYQDRVKMVKLDVTKSRETPARFGVLSIPTVIFFREGKEVDRITGVTAEEKVKEQIEALL